MTLKLFISIRSINATAVLWSTAVVVVLCLSNPTPIRADDTNAHLLAAELLIVRDDLTRLRDELNMPPAHVQGLRNRIQGSLGVMPWLLRTAGDVPGANLLRGTGPDDKDLIARLNDLIKRHPLDVSPYAPDRLTAKLRREAFTIHDAYCAGCHDGTGQGDADTALPARDLFLMARERLPEAFLARLINGVKGDKTLMFSNPLSPKQIGALWLHYQKYLQ